MSRFLAILLVAAFASLALLVFVADDSPPALKTDDYTPVTFPALKGPTEISGVAALGEFLIVATNDLTNAKGEHEPTVVQILKPDGAGYQLHVEVTLDAERHETDLEAVSVDAETRTVYVTGSHSWYRKRFGEGFGVERRKFAEQVFRFKLDEAGKAGPVEVCTEVLTAIEKTPLKTFMGVPSKENGIDIEGLAFRGERVHFGFRGPVLRDNWVPVLGAKFADPATTHEVGYVQLGGRGIRDLVAYSDGFVILAGPIGNGDNSFRIYAWNGKNGLATGKPEDQAKLVAELPPVRGKITFNGMTRDAIGRPEGLTILGHEGKRHEFLMVCDGLDNGGPVRFRLALPSGRWVDDSRRFRVR